MSEWKKIGEVGVDSGQVMLTDPCYIDSQWKKTEGDTDYDKKPTKEYSYEGCCLATCSDDCYGQLNYEMGHAGAGVVVSSGYGDGSYPVYAKFNKDGHIMEVKVVFLQ